MAVGDEAVQAGYPIVPATGEEGKVKWGYREINRTRDFIAALKLKLPTTKSGFREASGVTSGTATPDNAMGTDGDIYFKVV